MIGFLKRHHIKAKMAGAFAAAVLSYSQLSKDNPDTDAPVTQEISYAQLLKKVESGEIQAVYINDPYIKVPLENGDLLKARIYDPAKAAKDLLQRDADFSFKPISEFKLPRNLGWLMLFVFTLNFGFWNRKHVARWVQNLVNTGDENQKKKTSYHEAGHALVKYKLGLQLPKDYVTMVGNDKESNPHTHNGKREEIISDIKDKKWMEITRKNLEKYIPVLYAGLAAENILNGSKDFSLGCKGDIEIASKTIILLLLASGTSNTIPLGDERLIISEKSAKEWQKECDEIRFHGYNTARKILEENESALHALAAKLREKSFLNARQIAETIENAPRNIFQPEFDFS